MPHVGLADKGRDVDRELRTRQDAGPKQDGGLGRLVKRERVEVEPLGPGLLRGWHGLNMRADGGDGGMAKIEHRRRWGFGGSEQAKSSAGCFLRFRF